MFSARKIKEAILSAGRPAAFPYGVELTAAELERIRTEPVLAEAVSKVDAYVEQARRDAIPNASFADFLAYERSGDRKAFEAPMFERRSRLRALQITALLEGREEDLRLIEELVWSVCDEYTWASPAHYPVGVEAAVSHRLPPDRMVDLFAAMTAQLLAELDLVFGERLHPWIRYRIREEVERRVFTPVYDLRERFGWESAAHNWNAVCMGSSGVAALILVEDKERLAAIVDRTVGAMECYLEGFGEDGGCPEGVGYWNFGFGHFTEFAEALRTYTGGALNLFEADKVARIAEFPFKAALSEGAYAGFSDAPSHIQANTAAVCKLASLLPVRPPYLNGLEGELRRRLPELRSLLWTVPELLRKPLVDGSFYLPDQMWLIDRRKLEGTAFAFAAKGGHNDEPHNHNDLGHFILHIGGDSLLADLGAGRYTRESFGPNRYELLHNGSHGHSVPVIAGCRQASGPAHAARDVHYEKTDNGCLFRMTLTDAYACPQLEEFVRSFRWRYGANGAELALEDNFRLRGEGAGIEEAFISECEPALTPGTAVWRGAGGSVTLRYDAGLLTPRLDTIETLNHYGEPSTVYRLVLSAVLNGGGHLRFAFALNRH